MKLFDVIAVGLAIAGALTYLVFHFARSAIRFRAKSVCADCVAAAAATAHGTRSNLSKGNGCPGCG
jgi:hypothetical protein